jgi:hypothetical protein
VSEDDGSMSCFRCRGLAVINKKSLENLPKILFEASNVIWGEHGMNASDLVERLRSYAIMIEGMPSD